MQFTNGYVYLTNVKLLLNDVKMIKLGLLLRLTFLVFVPISFQGPCAEMVRKIPDIIIPLSQVTRQTL